jgi:hypothetical protein
MNRAASGVGKAWASLGPRGTRWLVACGLFVLTLLLYWPGLGGGYVFDDFPNIVDNKALHVATLDWHAWVSATFSSPVADLPRPLAMLSFAFNHYFTGLDPQPMKLTNIAIHLLNTLLVLGLVRALFAAASPSDGVDLRREWAARFAAAAWALHPINLMAVLFVVQRMESLAHTFVFAGLWLYVVGRGRQRSGQSGWLLVMAGVIGCTGLGLLSKESAALLPLYALCLELCIFRFRNHLGRDRRLIALHATVLLLPAIVGLAWLLPKVLSPGAFAHRDFTLGERLLTETRVVLDYLCWTLLPDLRQLSLYHDDYVPSRGLWTPPSTLLGLALIPILLGVGWWLRQRRPLLALGLLWFFAAQVLTATIIPLELVYEHRNYFASLGVCIALADLLLLAPSSGSLRRLGGLVALLAIMSFAAITHLRAREWSDQLRFAHSEAAKHPLSPRATYDLARLLVVMTRYQPDSPLLQPAKEALDRARNAPNSGIAAHSASLLLAANTGAAPDPDWWREMRIRLQRGSLGPQEVGALKSLTYCARDGTCRFPPGRMLELYLAALEHGPNPDVLSMYGDYALNVLHDSNLALLLWREAVKQQPRVAQYRINLIKLLIATGRHEEAQALIAELRGLGRFGQNEAEAGALELRLDAARTARDSRHKDTSTLQRMKAVILAGGLGADPMTYPPVLTASRKR